MSPLKRRIAAMYDRVAAGYDAAPLRLFPFVADRLVPGLGLSPGDKLLDVAAGTGAVALAAAQALTPGGRVTAVDISEGMLARLDARIGKFGIANIDAHVIDGESLEFRRDYFHRVISSFGLTFMPDPAAALREWARVTRPGGSVTFTAPVADALEPMNSLLAARLTGGGLSVLSEDDARRLLIDAGLVEITVKTEALGYHVKNTGEWWELAWFSGLYPALHELTPTEQEQIQRDHLAETGRHQTGDGLRIDARYLVATGRKPG
jgi:SAM-dependent methyltransferase